MALVLLALGFGYKIFVDATKELGSIKTFGRLLGVFIILTSLVLGVMDVALALNKMKSCSTKAGAGKSSHCWMK